MSAPRGVRLDKWLWAARFFKTRGLAKTAIETGKVQCNGERPKVSREVAAGDTLAIRQGWDTAEVLVRAVSDQRGPAPQARQLYEETPESLERRQKAAAERAAQRSVGAISPERPNKKQRRQIHRFRDLSLD